MFQKISVENYKSIKTLPDFELKPVNILIGANNYGKNNFFDVFAFLRDTLSDQMPNGQVDLNHHKLSRNFTSNLIRCSESLRLAISSAKQVEQYTVDALAITRLLRNNLEALREGQIEIELRGFNGKDEFMQKVPLLVRNSFESFRHRSDEIEFFFIGCNR